MRWYYRQWLKRFKTQILQSLRQPRNDLYHWLLIISWWQFIGLIGLVFLAINCLFALAYLATDNGIANADPNSFSDAFFFSVQSFSTIGYGAMYPQTLLAEILVTIEVLVGLLMVAITTGLVFARFSRPTARVRFSRVAVICPFEGVPTLMFRAANQRNNRILAAKVQVSLLQDETSIEGHQLRRFYDLKLLRSQTPSFGLSWLIMHPIDVQSPIYGLELDILPQKNVEIWVSLTGLDETMSQTIHARYVYQPWQILKDMKFVDIFVRQVDGSYSLNYGDFDRVIPAHD